MGVYRRPRNTATSNRVLHFGKHEENEQISARLSLLIFFFVHVHKRVKDYHVTALRIG